MAPSRPAAGSFGQTKIPMHQGIPIEKAKDIVKFIKNRRKGWQASYSCTCAEHRQDRDSLQEIIALMKQPDFGI